MTDAFPRFRLRALSKVRQTSVSDLEGSGLRGAAVDADAPAPEASGISPLLVATMPGVSPRPHLSAPTGSRSFARMIPLQSGASILLQSLSPRLFVVGVHDRIPELAVCNREELRLLRAAIDVALEVSE